jgi:hypothetical protein
MSEPTLRSQSHPQEDDFVQLDGERYFRIRAFDRMAPFFMTLVSGSDHWLFVSSCGALTAGRVDSNSAIFPYYTEDKLRDTRNSAGSLCAMLVARDGQQVCWEPFGSARNPAWKIERNLYKNTLGSRLVFEERNASLGLTYRYAWRFSDRFGLVRTARLVNEGHASAALTLLDGLRNILPCGVSCGAQQEFSNLLDAYKCSEWVGRNGPAVFALTAGLCDRPVPCESLRATTAWQTGLQEPTVLLSEVQAAAFLGGHRVEHEPLKQGTRGAFLLATELSLRPGEARTWSIAVEVNQDSAAVVALRERLRGGDGLAEELEQDIDATDDRLRRLIASADGLQSCAQERVTVHHAANVLFNIMRGGLPAAGYSVQIDHWREFVAQRNAPAAARHAAALAALPPTLTIEQLRCAADGTGSGDLARLARQYLPFTFSRRHGDPSRPWNRFAIRIKHPDGSPCLAYEGNWRDIFQNWEALGYSYPGYFENFVEVFLSATTADGYNPYRVSDAGIDWEVPEPHSVWSAYGYWGDHQIVYLQRMLEALEAFHPGRLAALRDRPLFSHANVPYRISPYPELLRDPRNSVTFDRSAHTAVEERLATLGSDGRLVLDSEGQVVHVTLAEKLLILLLAKLANFIPGGGIWMNTQRPEWNDSNNALAGYGLSVVTTCHLHRFLVRMQDLFSDSGGPVALTHGVAAWMEATLSVLEAFADADAPLSDPRRKAFMDGVGNAASTYRSRLYAGELDPATRHVTAVSVRRLLELSRELAQRCIRGNRRDDGLYHAYNVLERGTNGARVRHLDEMLEGQVAVLSAELLSPVEALDLLRALRRSALYREDQHSYLLNPRRSPPTFLERNCVPACAALDIPLLNAMHAAGDERLVKQDVTGEFHFNGAFANHEDVQRTLAVLRTEPRYSERVAADADRVLGLFEDTFKHRAYLGRAGSMFAYEGVGSIYWHMVSKLLLAAQECLLAATEQGVGGAIALRACYEDIRAGLGFGKSPEVWGGFPTDPYSHTPWGRGAAQPGMTGQVKEEVLTRRIELGVQIRNGRILLAPETVPLREFGDSPRTFDYVDVAGRDSRIELPARALAFTLCQTPVVYRLGDPAIITVQRHGLEPLVFAHGGLDAATSRSVFAREGIVARIDVGRR